MKDEIDTDAEVFDGWSVVRMQCKCVCRLSSSLLWDLKKNKAACKYFQARTQIINIQNVWLFHDYSGTNEVPTFVAK